MIARALLRPVARLTAQQPTRAFTVAAAKRAGAGPPQLLGKGAEPGTVPTDLEQATGLERMELLAKLQGEDPFFMAPLIPEHMGTLSKPIMVKSLDSYRIVGCTGFPIDSHDTLYFKVHKEGKPTRCPECGCAYGVEYLGPPEGEHHHH